MAVASKHILLIANSSVNQQSHRGCLHGRGHLQEQKVPDLWNG